MKKKYCVSAIIPTHNSGKYIEETIRSVLDQSVKFDEVVVVDGDSTDNTVEVLKKFKGVKVVVVRPDPDRIAVRNIGWKAARGNIIAFIDSDLVLVKGWLKEVLRGFDAGHVAVVDRRAVYQPRTLVARMNDHFFDLRFAEKYKPFTAWVVRKDVLEQLQGLDEGVIGFEDVDLGDRLYAAGYDIYFAKDALAYHKGEPTNFKTEMRRHFWFGSHALPYWKKRRLGRKPLRVAIFSLVTVLFLIRPLWALGLAALPFLYVVVKDAVYFRMKWRYVPLHAFIAVASEFTYAYGVVYALVRGPMRYARSSDAQVAKKASA